MSSHSVEMREELLRQFIESGERERLQEILRSKLYTSGWQDRVKGKCQEIIKENDIEKITVDDIAEGVTPFARSTVPEDIKADILTQIRSFVYKALPESDS